MAARRTSTPPLIDGFEAIELLGSGGYADVYLYQQEMPSRRVAVKVLSAESLSGVGGQQFADEANLMAKVSTHPYIVTIFEAAVSADGRPYLVMEYYPGEDFMHRARRETLAVDEVLRVAVHVAGAVETAHRAGILHRDIKPANILTSEFRRPGLTDFGIASSLARRTSEASGMSIPWAPPEVLAGGDGVDVRTDVYSLAATVYTLLSGRSPFETPNGPNGPVDLMGRIGRLPVPPLQRADVPTSLHRVLAQAMAPSPTHRPASAAAFAHQLQEVEAELRLTPTPLELPDTGQRRGPRVEDADATRLRGVRVVDAQPVASPRIETTATTPGATAVPEPVVGLITAVPERPGPVAPGGRRLPEAPALPEPAVEQTIVRPPAPAEAAAPPSRRPSRVVVAGAVAALLAVAIGGVVALGGDGGDSTGEATTSLPITSPASVGPVPRPAEGRAVRDGDRVVFTWTVPTPEPGDQFLWQRVDGATPGERQFSEEPTVTLDAVTTDEKPCIRVALQRANLRTSPDVTICAP